MARMRFVLGAAGAIVACTVSGCTAGTAGRAVGLVTSTVTATATVAGTTTTVPDTVTAPTTVTVTERSAVTVTRTREVTRTATRAATATGRAGQISGRTPTTNAHGYIPKKVGEVAGLASSTDAMLVSFTVTKIELDPTCDSGIARKPQNGHFLAVHMTVRTSKDYNAESDGYLTFSQDDFRIIGPDNTVENNVGTFPAYECLTLTEMLPHDDLVPGTTIKGAIVLDTQYRHGSLVMTQPGMTGGWEWTY